MEISNLLQADIKQLVNLQPEEWSDLRTTCQFYIDNDYCEPFKLSIDNKMVGIGTAILHENVGWLSTIVTHRQYRKMGIGKAITEHLVVNLQAKNCEKIYLIATALGEPVYAKVGFKVESHYHEYKNIKLENERMSNYIVNYSEHFTNQILALDATISGENRSNHLETFLSETFLFVKNGLVEGIYFPTFGEGLVIANTDEAGVELMKKRFKTENKASFPIENLAGAVYLKSKGYEPTGKISRMYFGEKMLWQPQNLYNKVGGNIG
jgi:N-acetylglutamate synthase-like GNAT family acetyltransferase